MYYKTTISHSNLSSKDNRRKNYVFCRFVPSLDEIQKNHPYLGGLTLAEHAENGTLYVVDLTEVDIDENEIKMKSDDKVMFFAIVLMNTTRFKSVVWLNNPNLFLFSN